MKAAASLARLLVQPLIIGLFAALVARATLLQAYSIPSASMAPTLQPGDHILVTPPLLGGAIERGDVVVFRNPDAGPGFFVKRVVAVGGDYVEIRGGTLRLNGRPVGEEYLGRSAVTEGRATEIIPAGHLYVLGDNRSDSIDSRAWGLLPESRVVGRARVIFWSSGAVAASSAAAQSTSFDADRELRPRWDRILRPIR
jgi:signal peptidase I